MGRGEGKSGKEGDESGNPRVPAAVVNQSIGRTEKLAGDYKVHVVSKLPSFACMSSSQIL